MHVMPITAIDAEQSRVRQETLTIVVYRRRCLESFSLNEICFLAFDKLCTFSHRYC